MLKVIMRNSLFYLLIFGLGIVVGAAATWVNSYSTNETDINHYQRENKV